jgi:hypothetical protein
MLATMRRANDRLELDLRDLLVERASGLASLLGCLDEALRLQQAAETRAATLAALLRSNDDDQIGEALVDLATAGVLPSPLPPEDSDWWHRPFGRVVAKALGHPAALSVSYSVASAKLGLTRKAVADLVESGDLDEDPDDGGVTVASLRRYLEELKELGLDLP